MSQPRTIFITGTDTGVGKTILTALLLTHLRAAGGNARALKPFCSGDRQDAEILHALQDGELTLDQINPFYFPEPLAPFVAARRHRRSISLPQALDHIRRACSTIQGKSESRKQRAEIQDLLIEGVGGLMVPLGEGYMVLDLIKRLGCEVIVVAPNKLGVINHTLLTVGALRAAGLHRLKVVLMNPRQPDASGASNPALLAELIAPVPLFPLPFLGPDCVSAEMLKKKSRLLNRALSRIAR